MHLEFINWYCTSFSLRDKKQHNLQQLKAGPGRSVLIQNASRQHVHGTFQTLSFESQYSETNLAIEINLNKVLTPHCKSQRWQTLRSERSRYRKQNDNCTDVTNRIYTQSRTLQFFTASSSISRDYLIKRLSDNLLLISIAVAASLIFFQLFNLVFHRGES